MSNSKPLPAARRLTPDQLLPPIGTWSIWAGLILMGAIGMAVALASVLKYSTSVRATAIVRPVGELRWVQAGIAGKISHIRVQVNQPVRLGDVIAQLDATSLQTRQQQLQTQLQQEQTQLDQLDQQLQLLTTKIAAETNSAQHFTAIANAELERDQQALETQQIINQSELEEANAALSLATNEYQRYQQLGSGGAVSQIQIEEKLAAVKVAEQRVTRAIAVLSPDRASLSIAQQRLFQVKSAGQSALATLKQEQSVLMQQQSVLNIQKVQTQQALRQIQSELAQTTIRATGNGVILRFMLRNPGQTIQVGETLAEIAPTQEALNLRATVAPQDIHSVQLGQVAQMRVTACPYPDYGLLKGRVIAISPDVVSSQEPPPTNLSTPRQPASFEVTIRPDQLELKQGDRRCSLQAGMEAEAAIVAQEETFLRFLLRRIQLLGDGL
jgi:HlyD family secretion protein